MSLDKNFSHSDLRIIRLSDYRPPLWFVSECELEFELDLRRTKIVSTLHMYRNKELTSFVSDIVLDGENLELLSVYLDDRELSSSEYKLSSDKLIIPLDGKNSSLTNCKLKTVCIINPLENSELSGLYRSGNFYCTQCEAEGFRRITYFPDRPDILCLFKVSIIADAKGNDYLLSNGNLVSSGLSKDGTKLYANWHLPIPIPCYLFALVGGDFDVLKDQYITLLGKKKIDLFIYTEKGKKNRAHFAMQALKRAMSWDEKIYGFEYDLQCFMIVAVSDFNMGAMENKGLNIFNDKYLLADKEHATDQDYQNIERIVAHEYFHNWTGNRITCRDWFQICLKEGLTVFREQQYCADITSQSLERIKNIRFLQKTQFLDDKGPLAHPVRPEQYSEINNFYNTTVYEKGAEIFRMINVILGEEAYQQGIKKFFEEHDKKAATVEDILKSIAKANPKYQKLLQNNMLNWYKQAGTPILQIETEYLKDKQQYKLKITQKLQEDIFKPQPIPIKIALLDDKGEEKQNLKISLFTNKKDTSEIDANINANINANIDSEDKDKLIIMQQKQLDIVFDEIQSKPYLSIMRGFSAPVILDYHQSDETLAFLSIKDSDICNRWHSIHLLALRYLVSSLENKKNTQKTLNILLECYDKILNSQIEPDIKQLLLTPPSYEDVVLAMEKNIQPGKIVDSIEKLYLQIGLKLEKELEKQYLQLTKKFATILYQPDRQDMKFRSYKNFLLLLLAKIKPEKIAKSAAKIYQNADNLTDKQAILEAVNNIKSKVRDELLNKLIDAKSKDHMLIDKYLSLQARLRTPNITEHIKQIMQQKYFEIKKPNHVFSLLGTFAFANHKYFHNEDETGYELIAQFVMQIDSFNPQVAARLMSCFSSITTLVPVLQKKIRKRVEIIVNQNKTSINVREIGTKILKATEIK